MPAPSHRLYRFCGHRMDMRARELRDEQGARVALTGKVFDVLGYLVEHRDRVVAKDELMEAVWAGRVVEENSLAKAVSALRHALGVDAADHRFIVTVPGRGYRFVADVMEEAEPVMADADGARPGARSNPQPAAAVARHWPLMLGALLAFGLMAIVAWSLHEPQTPLSSSGQTTLAGVPFRPLSGRPPDQLLELGLAD